MNYSFFRLSKQNLHELIPIFLSAFGKAPDLKSLSETYNTDFSGVSNIGYISYSELDKPVSFYGVFPMLAYIKGKILLVSQSGNTMTHKDHIGNGLFITGAKKTYTLCKENNINGVFGFPSASSYTGFKKKLDWIFNENIKKYSFFVPTLPIAILVQRFKFLNSLYLWWVRIIISFYKKPDFFQGSILRNGQDGIYRDEEFWNYKLQSKNTFIIKLGEMDLVVKANGKLSVGDINIDNSSSLEPIIKKLKLLSLFTFNTNIVFYVSPETILGNKLDQIKKSTEGLPIGFLNFNNDVDLSTLKFTYFDFDTF